MNTPQTGSTPATGRRPHRVSSRASAARDTTHTATHEETTHVEQPAPRTRTRTRMTSAAPPTHDNYINRENIPGDISLNWKLFTAIGQEYPYYLQQMRNQGWEPVNPQEHPDWVNLPPGYSATTCVVDGLILMERPMYLTEEAEEDNYIMATQRIREAEQRLGRRESDREAEPLKPRLVKEIGRMVPAIEGED